MEGTFEPPTPEQRGLYWIWVTEIARSMAMDKDSVHAWLKTKFNDGKSTMNLHTLQFAEYMNAIKTFADINEIDLPEPR